MVAVLCEARWSQLSGLPLRRSYAPGVRDASLSRVYLSLQHWSDDEVVLVAMMMMKGSRRQDTVSWTESRVVEEWVAIFLGTQG